MDYQAYKDAYYTDPVPGPRFQFEGPFGITLYYQDYQAAVSFYEEVLGPPGYVEGAGTRGWRIGSGWLTLLQGKSGNPRNVEMIFEMATVEQAEALQSAFIAAGAQGPAPSDQLMYVPIRACSVTDPFGMEIMIISLLDQE